MHRFHFFETRYRTLILNIALLFIGILLVAASSFIDSTRSWGNANLAAIVANIGALIGIIGLMQGVYEASVRRKFFEEIFTSISSSKSIFDTGLIDASPTSHTADLSSVIIDSDELTLVFSHSKRFIDRYQKEFTKRTSSKKKTNIYLNHATSNAVKYYIECGRDAEYVRSSIAEFIRGIESISKVRTGTYTVSYIDVVPKYSLVKSEKIAFLILSTSSEGQTSVPQITIRKDSPLWEFISTDLKNLQNSHVLSVQKI